MFWPHFSVYVDISDPEEECATLSFNFKDREITREWNITITQISCNYENRAPPGCLQYHFGVNEDGVGGVIQSFNFNGGYHLGVFHVCPVCEVKSLLKHWENKKGSFNFWTILFSKITVCPIDIGPTFEYINEYGFPSTGPVLGNLDPYSGTWT